jgi:hypothetical protein
VQARGHGLERGASAQLLRDGVTHLGGKGAALGELRQLVIRQARQHRVQDRVAPDHRLIEQASRKHQAVVRAVERDRDLKHFLEGLGVRRRRMREAHLARQLDALELDVEHGDREVVRDRELVQGVGRLEAGRDTKARLGGVAFDVQLELRGPEQRVVATHAADRVAQGVGRGEQILDQLEVAGLLLDARAQRRRGIAQDVDEAQQQLDHQPIWQALARIGLELLA